jgi:type IV pilus assembly protein PilP
MKKQNQTYFVLVLIVIGLIFLMSCHEPEKKTVPESTPKIIRQKVMIAAHSQPSITKKAESTALTVNNIEKKLASKDITSDKEITAATNTSTQQSGPNNAPDTKQQLAVSSPKPQTDNTSDKSTPPSETEMEMLLQKLAPKPLKYRPQGKMDPFLPLIAKKKKTTPVKSDTVDKNIQKRRTRILTLLEKYDLSQLKLTAVLRTSKHSVAIVEETSGRGFIVKTGTRIGLNSGRVVDILLDRIIIQETEEVLAGKKLYVTKEMKLNKPDSEF